MLCWNNGLSEENGIRGVRIYGPNEHSIFLPVCGFGLWNGEQDPFHNTDGAYWTGVEDSEQGPNGKPIEPSNYAKSLLVDLSGFTGATSRKAGGLNIRAVVNPKEVTGIDNVISDTGNVRLIYSNGRINIIGKQSEGTITLFDLSGRMIYSSSVLGSTCRVPELTSGIYLVSYKDNVNTVKTQKITIK